MSDTVLAVDLPGADSVEVGFALAAVGFRPVPLYNASPGPEEVVGLGAGSPGVWNAVIDMGLPGGFIEAFEFTQLMAARYPGTTESKVTE
jgi:hypothetical protein